MIDSCDKKDDRLLPCPFCGTAPMWHADYAKNRKLYRAHIECKSCGASMHISTSNSNSLERIAIEKWNKRI